MKTRKVEKLLVFSTIFMLIALIMASIANMQLQNTLSKFDKYPSDVEIRRHIAKCAHPDHASPAGMAEYFILNDQGEVESEIEIECY